MKNKKTQTIKQQLKNANTKAYKSFGQNFLIDQKYVEYMIDSLNIQNSDWIVEIGPGMGALTQKLLERINQKKLYKVQYLGVDYDIEKIEYLRHEFPNLEFKYESILDFDIERFIHDNAVKNYKLLGSLPFNISKKIIQKFSQTNFCPQKAVLMVQKEVGQEYIAKPGSTFLSIYINEFWHIADSLVIPSTAFFPIPDVSGLVMVLEKKDIISDIGFLKFAKNAYVNPRKKLGNILHLDKNAKFYNKRPHELNLSQWHELYTLILNTK